jgi:hypothetical protein
MLETALPVLTELVVVQRHHKGGASVVAPSASTAVPGTIKVGAGMFSRSLLFDADLIKLKADREAAQQSYGHGKPCNITW